MMKLTKLEKTGATIGYIKILGFDGIEFTDPQNNEIYEKLYIDNQYVGDTEHNETNNDMEIICYDRNSYQIVKDIVKESVTVWAWFDNIFTNLN